MIASTMAEVQGLLDTLWTLGQEIILQELVAESRGKDVRALVIGDQVVAAMRRTARAGEFRSNIHRGGEATALELPRELRRGGGQGHPGHGAGGGRRRHAGGAQRARDHGGQQLARLPAPGPRGLVRGQTRRAARRGRRCLGHHDGPHSHDDHPDRPDLFVYGYGSPPGADRWSSPYDGGHPLPGGAWCFVEVPHRDDYDPPAMVRGSPGVDRAGTTGAPGPVGARHLLVVEPCAPTTASPGAGCLRWGSTARRRRPCESPSRHPGCMTIIMRARGTGTTGGSLRIPLRHALRHPLRPNRRLSGPRQRPRHRYRRRHPRRRALGCSPPPAPPPSSQPAKDEKPKKDDKKDDKKERKKAAPPPRSPVKTDKEGEPPRKQVQSYSRIRGYTPPHEPLLTAVLLVSAGAFFAFTMVRRLVPLLALRRETGSTARGAGRRARSASASARSGCVDPEELTAGLLHVVLFAAFLVLALRTITLFGVGFSPDFHLPAARRRIGARRGLRRRQGRGGAGRARRGARLPVAAARHQAGPGDPPPGRATLVLGFIIGLMVTEILFEGAESPPGRVAGRSGRIAGPGSGLACRRRGHGAATFWLHLVIILLFLNFLPFGKHFHVITALPNVFCRRLPPRGGAAQARPRVRGRPLRHRHREGPLLEGGPRRLHLHRVRPLPDPLPDLRHRQAAQPQGGQPGAPPPPRTRRAGAGGAGRAPAAGAGRPPPRSCRHRRGVRPETVWACTTCGWCETACPVLIENVPRLIDMRRQAVLVDSVFPDEAARVFKGIETQGNPWGIGSNQRAEWCEDLAIPRAADGGDYEYLFFVGCAGAFDDRQKKVSRAIVQILREAKVTFAILGEEETCTGDAARRLGNEYLFQMQATG